MERIASFSVDHNKLEPGIYVSRQDGDITTYDMRFIKPNTPPFLPNPVMHTIEHLFATYSRNSEYGEKVVYFGPMGCRTGFYFLVRDMSREDALAFIKETVKKCMEHQGEIPGRSAVECGNYKEMDVEGAYNFLKEYYELLKVKNIKDLEY